MKTQNEVTALAKSEYAEHRDRFVHMAISESLYIETRLRDEGLFASPVPTPKKNTNPLVSDNPSGNEVGSKDEVTIQ